jgi:hypothetical protein
MRRLLCAAIISAPLTGSPLSDEDPWRAAGAFENDTWLPRDVELERALAAADEARSDALTPDQLEDIFRGWRAALNTGGIDSWVRWDTLTHWESNDVEPTLWSERRVEGLSNAISLRLAQSDQELLLPWSHFNAAQADASLADALTLPVERRHAPLAELCARYPGTHANVRAALLLNELDRELGRPHHARAWQRRAEQLARLLRDTSLIAAAVARADERPQIATEEWETADEWEHVDFAALSNDTSSPASGVRGMTRWNDTELFIQSAELGWTLGDQGRGSGFALEELARLSQQPLARGWKRPGSSWRHRPSAQGELAFSVLGRVRDVRSNALFAFRPGAPPVPRWSLGEGGWRDANGAALSTLEEAIGPGAWEFQPCPLAVDDVLIVQARRWDISNERQRSHLINPARPEAVALALDIKTGELIWKRSLARGSDLLPGEGERFAATRTPAISAPTPVLCGTSLIFATGLGACAALDLADGRPERSVLGQRAKEGTSYASPPTPIGEDRVLWAPFGGDSVYELALGSLHPDLASSPFTKPPKLSSGWSAVIGTYKDSPLVALVQGGRYQIEHLEKATRSIQMSLGEALIGAHLLGSERLLSVSDRGLFIFDLARELYLVGHIPLDPSVQCLPAGLVAAGTHAWILTEEGVYRLRVKNQD